MPPPKRIDTLLSEKVQLVTVSVPLLVTPPPSPSSAVPSALPLAIVRSFRVSVAPEFTIRTT
jgi:hypothetical protein